MDDSDRQDEPRVQADNSGVAVGGFNIRGNVSGTIHIGHGFTSEQVSTLITQIKTTFQPKPFDGRCPYKGLDVFEEEDAELFFARAKLVVEALVKITKGALINRVLFSKQAINLYSLGIPT